jgi:hypothetical protein
MTLMDRAALQRQAVLAHRAEQRKRLDEQREQQRRRGRESLAKATDGRIAKLKARCEERLERIRQSEQLSLSFADVAAILIQIGP